MAGSSRPRLGLLLLAGCVLALAVAACSDGEGSARGVLPIEEILASDINVVADRSGTRATVEVTTSIPLACAVIYGVDDSFGSIAVDNDMRGGAHEDHRPLLANLEPDTEYLFVLQGSDASGSLYRSEVMTFSTPAAAAPGGLGPNIAPTGAVTAASSSFSVAFDPELAIDGDLATEWSTAGDGDDASIEIDLGTTTEVSGFGMRSRVMSDGTAIIETYTVTVDDGEVLGPFPAGQAFSPSQANVTGQRFRFDAETTTGGNTGAAEIEIYAAG